MKEPKWHYFNENDDRCRYVSNSATAIALFIIEKTEFYTACMQKVGKVKRHTEHKNSVTCLQCLKTLNKWDNIA